MNPKTESETATQQPQQSEFSPEFIRWLLLLTGATLLLVFLSNRFLGSSAGKDFSIPMLRGMALSPYPWVAAGGQTISFGLDEFSGKVPSSTSPRQRYFTLLSLLLGFVVCPTLFFFGWRHSRLRKESGQDPSILRSWNVAVVLGGIFTFTVAVPSIPAAIAQALVSESLRSAQAVSENRDYMINDLARLAMSAYQYRLLPVGLGGGGSTYTGYKLPPELTKTENATYEVLKVNGDGVTIKATSATYPGCTITVAVSNEGMLRGWKYEGKIQ